MSAMEAQLLSRAAPSMSKAHGILCRPQPIFQIGRCMAQKSTSCMFHGALSAYLLAGATLVLMTAIGHRRLCLKFLLQTRQLACAVTEVKLGAAAKFPGHDILNYHHLGTHVQPDSRTNGHPDARPDAQSDAQLHQRRQRPVPSIVRWYVQLLLQDVWIYNFDLPRRMHCRLQL